MSRASSIALKGSDLGAGWAPFPRDPTPCNAEPDESALVQTGGADRTYVKSARQWIVGSRVEIFRTRREAMRDWKLATLRVVASCLFERTRAEFAQQHVAVAPISAFALKPPTRGERSLHYRIAFLLSQGSRSVAFVTDVVGIGIGRISVFLRTSIPQSPIADGDLHSLTGLLAKRLVAAAGGI